MTHTDVRSLKVIDYSTNGEPVCNFILPDISVSGPIWHLWDVKQLKVQTFPLFPITP